MSDSASVAPPTADSGVPIASDRHSLTVGPKGPTVLHDGEAHYEAVPRVTFTDPHAAAVGATEDAFSATARLNAVAKTATYTRAYAESNGSEIATAQPVAGVAS